jgi:Arc/MetJ family transcription regulator
MLAQNATDVQIFFPSRNRTARRVQGASRDVCHTAIFRDMAVPMKTTVHIADALLAEAQKVARRENTTLKALINEGLRKALAERPGRKTPKMKDCSFPPSGGRQHKSDQKSWEDIRAIIYEGRGE